MKKIFYILPVLAVSLFASGCEDFLDKREDVGLDESDVFRDYYSLRGFLDQSFNQLENTMVMDNWENARAFCGLFADEMATTDNASAVFTMHSGNWLFTSKTSSTYEIGNGGNTAIARSYKVLRINNRIINDIDLAPLSEEQKHEILGQAYFYRAWFYFQIIKRYGGMMIIDKVFEGGDDDIPRKTYHESHDWMMQDIERAIEMLPDYWPDEDYGRPTKIAAMAFKEWAQLYDASPLMQNDLNTIVNNGYDKQRALLAAQSAYDVIEYMDNSGSFPYPYGLATKDEYTNVFYFKYPPVHQPEFIWAKRQFPNAANQNQKRTIRTFWQYEDLAFGSGPDGNSMSCPTLNIVNMYDRKGEDGIYYPVDDPRSGYKLEHADAGKGPFDNRDPRFYNNILLPGEAWGHYDNGNVYYITTYAGGDAYEHMLTQKDCNQRMFSGFMCKKFMWPECNQYLEKINPNCWWDYRFMTVYIRASQIYLDYAEALFEATGSATATAEGCPMTAEEAINVIRSRMDVTDLPDDIVADPEKFRQAYRRERAVELMFENHRWWDLRRWMILEETFKDTYPIKGVRFTPRESGHASIADKTTLTFDYEQIDLTPEVRGYTIKNYWYPLPQHDVDALDNLQQNPYW